MRFEVLLNGERLCIGGFQDFGVLTTTCTWIKRNPDDYDPSHHLHSDSDEWSKETTVYNVGGMPILKGEMDEHVDWAAGHLKIGDEFVVRVLADGEIDSPKSRRRWPKGSKPWKEDRKDDSDCPGDV